MTDQLILRMAEAELASELLIAISDGVHSKKSSESFYKRYDPSFPNGWVLSGRFRKTMDTIGEIFGDMLGRSSFRRVHMFYTLFCSIYHCLFGIPGAGWPRKSLKKQDYAKVCHALEAVDEIFEKEEEERSVQERRFLTAARRATTDASVRDFRSRYVCELIVRAI